MTEDADRDILHWAIILALAVYTITICGCVAPQAIVDVDAAASRSLAGYVQATDEIVHQVTDAYRREAEAHARYRWRVAMDAASAGTGTIPRETVEAGQKELDRILGEIETEARKVEIGLARARLDLKDAEDFRAEVRRYLDASGVSPEAARAVGDMILERMR